eukprot:2359167-Amphidinium_carterae.1
MIGEKLVPHLLVPLNIKGFMVKPFPWAAVFDTLRGDRREGVRFPVVSSSIIQARDVGKTKLLRG